MVYKDLGKMGSRLGPVFIASSDVRRQLTMVFNPVFMFEVLC